MDVFTTPQARAEHRYYMLVQYAVIFLMQEGTTMAVLSSSEQQIVDTAWWYQSNQPLKWSGTDDRFNAWYDLAYQHLLERTLPRIRSTNEILVGCWPAYFVWGASSAHKRAFYEDRHYLYKMGTFGTGYTCLTVSNLYIASLKDATARFPLYDRGMKGFIGDVFGRMAGEVDDRKALMEDRAYYISMQSVLDAQIVQDQDRRDAMAFRTVNEQVLIYQHFSGSLAEIEAAYRMVHSGKLAHELGIASVPSEQLEASEHDSPVVKLRQLKEMLDAGLISSQEYESKKADILARM